MADYKKVSKNIKRFDRTRYTGSKAITIANQAKSRVKKNTAPADESTPEEFASDRAFEYGENAVQDTIYYANETGKKATENTIDNIKRYKIKKYRKEHELKDELKHLTDRRIPDESFVPRGSANPQRRVKLEADTKAYKTVNGNKVAKGQQEG